MSSVSAVENFNEEHRPKENGAWIIKNSWGTRQDVSMKEMKDTIFAALKEDHPDMDPIINIRGELEDQMMNLFVYSESHAEEVAKYMIRLQNLFATRNRPKEEFLGKIVGIYPVVFTVLDSNGLTKSFCYSDLLRLQKFR